MAAAGAGRAPAPIAPAAPLRRRGSPLRLRDSRRAAQPARFRVPARGQGELDPALAGRLRGIHGGRFPERGGGGSRPLQRRGPLRPARGYLRSLRGERLRRHSPSLTRPLSSRPRPTVPAPSPPPPPPFPTARTAAP